MMQSTELPAVLEELDMVRQWLALAGCGRLFLVTGNDSLPHAPHAPTLSIAAAKWSLGDSPIDEWWNWRAKIAAQPMFRASTGPLCETIAVSSLGAVFEPNCENGRLRGQLSDPKVVSLAVTQGRWCVEEKP